MISDGPPSSLASKVVPALLKLAARPRGRVVSVSLRLGFTLVVISVLVHLFVYLPHKVRQHQWRWNPEFEKPSRESASDHVCAPFSGFDRLVVTVKTGATEASNRIPVQLRTTLRCASQMYIFSDLAQKVGDAEIFDALDKITDEIKDGNADFDLYRKQQELNDPVKIMAQLKSMKSPDSDTPAAWTLDKYKFLHIMEKTWEMMPGMDWYLHIEADTYVIWPSLIEWLKRLDNKKDHFLGSAAFINDNPFAHGGSGYLLSGDAMRIFAGDHNGTAARWDSEMPKNCCGDFVLAQALKEYDIGPVMNSWPTINGESQNTIPFGDEHWCQPLVTMHHVSTEEMEEMGKFEDQRPNKSKPMTYEELFKGVMANKFPDKLKHWDNMAEGERLEDIESAERCTELCIADEACMQSKFYDQVCVLGTKTIVMGQIKMPEDNKAWESHWNTTRIKKWVKNRKPCGVLEFPHQH